MERISYYLMKGSENDGYYLKPGISNEQARERIGLIEDILGDDYDLSRLRALVQADRDGRCVVLPCKIGTTVYSVRHARVPDKDLIGSHIECSVVSQKFQLIHTDCIGKTVFLTREAAEEALKGES